MLHKNYLLAGVLLLAIFSSIIIVDLVRESWGENENCNARSLYKEGNKKLEIRDYDGAKKLYERIIKCYDNIELLKKLPQDDIRKVIFSIAYFKLSEILILTNRSQEAVDIMREVIDFSQQGALPVSKGAEALIQIGNIYLKDGNLPLAMEAFEQTIKHYPDLPHASAAKDAIERIDKQTIAEICGVVRLKDQETHSNIKISIFNGFSFSYTFSDLNGNYCLPIDTTPVSVFFIKDGYFPSVHNLRLVSEEKYIIPQVTLLPIKELSKGILVGVCYKSISGGKLKPRFGISSYLPKQTIKITDTGNGIRQEVTSDKNGIYMIILPPGRYQLFIPQGYEIKDVEIKPGKVTVQNISGGSIMID
jgi:hypothetical protein